MLIYNLSLPNNTLSLLPFNYWYRLLYPFSSEQYSFVTPEHNIAITTRQQNCHVADITSD